MNVYANAGTLFMSAVEFCREGEGANAASDEAQRRCLAAIVFAAVSTEAFINEVQRLAITTGSNHAEPDWVKSLGTILGDAENFHVSIMSKYQLANVVLSGRVLDRGRQPFQDFDLLIDLRNFLVHAKGETAVREKAVDGEWEWKSGLIQRLRSWGLHAGAGLVPQFIPSSEAARIESDAIAEISTGLVAQRACKAASEIVNSTLDSILACMPTSPRFSHLVDHIYRTSFATTVS